MEYFYGFDGIAQGICRGFNEWDFGGQNLLPFFPYLPHLKAWNQLVLGQILCFLCFVTLGQYQNEYFASVAKSQRMHLNLF